jgi:hypothetical protein
VVNRQQLAHFLLGFFVMPVSILLGGMEALFFHWHGAKAMASIAFFILVPLIGAIWTRQRVLTLGLIAGVLATGGLYWGCHRSTRKGVARSSAVQVLMPLCSEARVV